MPSALTRSEAMWIGKLHVLPISDGTFVARPAYFGHHLPPGAHTEFFGRHQSAWLPIGCFVVRTEDRIVLIDAGLGPELQELPHDMYLVGGQLPTGLRGLGIAAADVTDVVCSHLHSDHVGWLFDLDCQPIFSRAAVWLGAGDWKHFVTGTGHMAAHIREGFRTHASRVELIDQDVTVAPGVMALLTPGHTPGHVCVAISSGHERALLVGDAITCPVQLNEPSWHSMGDVDPALAERTRERLWRELEDEHTIGVGAHFPELQFGRVLPGRTRRWST
jgi:glyoxylase-like metal-dependent hydrolase (beta-lactamase superfamily II)